MALFNVAKKRTESHLQESIKTEIAVIGSGPGGAVTACLLAEAGRDVLLIEEGRNTPPDACKPFSLSEMVNKYRNGGLTVAFGSPKIAYVEGRCVGGGSEINSGLYHRTPPEVLDSWRKEFGVQALAEKDLVTHFEQNEKDISVDKFPGKIPVASLKLKEGADRLGWKAIEIPRCVHYDGSTDEHGFPRGTRQSMSRTFIPRTLQSGGKLLSETRALRIRKTGSNWSIDCGDRTVEASTVFVACGAIQTAALLRRSGFKSCVGNSLRVHPTVKVVAEFDETVNYEGMGVPVHQVKEFSPAFSFGGSISSRPYLALAMLDHPNAQESVLTSLERMAVYYVAVNGSGVGTVRTLPAFQDPLVHYRVTDDDLRIMADGIKKLGALLFQAGARALFPSIASCQKLTDPNTLNAFPESLSRAQTNLMTIHLMSSCPMGEDRSQCAADSFGQIHGVQNLFIADASLLCSALGVNPQGTIMAIARRNALKFLGRL